MLNWIEIAVSLAVIILYLVSFFILREIILRTEREIKKIFLYFFAAVFLLLLLRIHAMLAKVELLNLPYLQEILALALAFILTGAFYRFYKNISEITDGKKIRKVRGTDPKGKRIESDLLKKKLSDKKEKFRLTDEGYIDLTGKTGQ